MGLQVPFAPHLPVIFFFVFFVTVTIYLERLRPIKLIKQNKTQTLQWKHTKIAVQMTLAPTGTHSNQRPLLLPIV